MNKILRLSLPLLCLFSGFHTFASDSTEDIFRTGEPVASPGSTTCTISYEMDGEDPDYSTSDRNILWGDWSGSLTKAVTLTVSAMSVQPAKGDTITQDVSGATMLIYYTASNKISGSVTGTWNAVNTFTSSGDMTPSTNTPSHVGTNRDLFDEINVVASDESPPRSVLMVADGGGNITGLGRVTLDTPIDLSDNMLYIRFYLHEGSGLSSWENIELLRCKIYGSNAAAFDRSVSLRLYANQPSGDRRDVFPGWHSVVIDPYLMENVSTLTGGTIDQIMADFGRFDIDYITTTGGLSTTQITIDQIVALPKATTPSVYCATFDDGDDDLLDMATYMYNNGINPVKGTFYVIPSLVDTTGFMTLANLNTLKDQGHLIANHSWDATFFATGGLTSDEINEKINLAANWLEDNGFDKGSRIFATPGGNSEHNIHYHTGIVAVTDQIRGTLLGVETTGAKFDLDRLDADSFDNTTQADAQLAMAIANAGSLNISGWHSFNMVENGGSEYTQANWESHIDAVRAAMVAGTLTVSTTDELVQVETLDLVLNGTFGDGNTAWPAVDQWVTSGGNAVFTSTGTNRTLGQPTIGLVGETGEEATYKVTFTASGINLQDPTAYYGIQLGGGTANRFTQNKTYTFWIVASDSGGGLEISSVNTTAGDTLTIDDISVVVEQFKPSANLDSVFVTGDISVPAGAQLVIDSVFDDWSGTFHTEVLADWTLAESPTAVNNIQPISAGLGLKLTSDGTGLHVSQDILTAGKEYLLTIVVDSGPTGGVLDVMNGTKTLTDALGTETVSLTFVATDVDITITLTGPAGEAEIDSLTIYELTTGPIDQYASNGTHEGQTKYTSVNTHPDGVGGTEEWDMWWDGSTDWVISLTAGTLGTNYWDRTNASQIGAFNPNGNAVGTATTTFGPTDHSEATGSAGMKTDGVAGFIDLKTTFDFLNDLRAGKFGIVSVFNVDSDNADFARIMSSEVSPGYQTVHRTTGNVRSDWGGSGQFRKDTVGDTSDSLINHLITLNGSTGRILVNGEFNVSDTYTALDLAMSTLIRLGAKSEPASSYSKAKFAFTSIQNYDAVTTVDETWSTGLSQAINTAALASNYNAHAIARAINEYDSNITGVYYALNELSSGDASDYYLLAYDLQSQTAITQGFYGLVSPSGVTGTVLVPGGGYRGRYGGTYRGRYRGVGRY